jgi:hypothetical protein
MGDFYLRYYTSQARGGGQYGGGGGGGGNGVYISTFHRGPRFQRGYGIGGVFASLFRRVLPFLKSTAKDAGKTLLRAGLDTASDGLRGENVREAAKRNFENAGRAIGSDVIEKVRDQVGEGSRKRKRRSKSQNGGGSVSRANKRRKLATVTVMKKKKSVRKGIKGRQQQSKRVIRLSAVERGRRVSREPVAVPRTKAELFGLI